MLSVGMLHPRFVVVILLLCASVSVDAAALNATCFAPTSLGGQGFCGPSACNSTAVKSTKPSCNYTGAAIDYSASISKMQCRSCTQSSSSICSAATLKSLVIGTGIKAAYCTDTHLVIISDGSPSWTANLDDVPNPPGSTQTTTGTACVTRSASVTPSLLRYKIPLNFTLLSTAASSNNMAAFPDGAADSSAGYMKNTGTGLSYGLPTRGSVGVSVTGQDIFPLFNNRAEVTDDACEVDSCNEHVGGGGGQPHLHGDPFGPWCLYSAANYSTTTVHPPQIGWSIDGPSIFGRYLYTTSLGYSMALDDCGGHQHDSLAYHYHTQVVDTVTSTPANGMASGLSYAYSTVGVYKCWRADISKVLGFWDAGNNSTYFTPCCGMTQFYFAAGITTSFSSSTSPSSPSSAASSPAASPASGPTSPSSSSSSPAATVPSCTTPSSSPSPSTSSSSSPTSTSTKTGTCPKSYAISTSVTSILKTSSSNTAGVDLYQVSATGCPGRDWSGQTTPNSATYQNYVWSFPVSPVIASSPTYISRLKSYPNGSANSGSVMGAIGLTMDGVVVFNDADADKRDAYVYESVSFDSCRAHVNQGGNYHYHSEPGTGCVYNETAGKHSPMFAMMADGIPMYGAYGDGGKAPTDLDVCGGHTDTTYSFYHYHVTTNLTAPYTITCLMGCVFSNQGNQNLASLVKTSTTCTASAKQYNYSSLTIPWLGLTTSSSGRRRAQATSSQIPYTCPATTIVAAHTTTLGPALGTFDVTACNANAAKATLVSAAAYTTPSGSGTSGQLTIGSGSSLVTGGNLTIKGTVTCTLSDGTNTSCLALSSNAFPDHQAGPWCSGGNWNNTVVNYSAFATNCNCQRNSCNSSCSDMCLECPLLSAGTTYYIPINPTLAATTADTNGDNNQGDGITFAGVPLAKADPLALLSSINNPAPLDWYGGHASLQYVYHYHAIPTFHFNCSTGWDAYAHVWASTAPNAQHSQQIGWALDGFPVFGPFSVGGSKPTVKGSGSDDTDACYGHTHTPYGYHYHSRDVHDGKTAAFLGCYKGKRATQTFDSSSGGGPPGGASMTNTTSNPCSGSGTTTGGAAATCAAGITKTGVTQMCCGDGVCDGPETSSTCAADCSSSSSASPPASSSSSSTSPNSSSPSSSAASPTPSPAEAATVKKLQNTFQGMDYNALAANATKLSQFRSDVQRALATALGLSTTYVTIQGVTAGSVVVASEATFPASQFTADQANQVTTALVNSPSSAFSSAFSSTYGVTSVSAADVTPSSSSSSGLSTGAIAGIAVGGGVGGLLLIAGAAFLVMKKKPASAPGSGSGPAPTPTGVKVLPVDHDV